jgi:hypothetical protein
MISRGRPAVAIAGFSASIFLLEVLLTRLFSVTLFHHFAFAAISIGMLGLAASGVRVALRRPTPDETPDAVVGAAVLFAATALAAVLILVQIGLFPSFTWERLLMLAIVYGVCFVPFYFGGLGLALILSSYADRFARLYASDLAAAGLAGLAVFPLLRGLGGPAAIVAAALVALVATLLAFPEASASLRGRGALVLVVGVALIGADALSAVLRPRRPKGDAAAASKLIFDGWNALSRVVVYDDVVLPWSLSPRYRGQVSLGLRMDIDAAAATPIINAKAGSANEYLRYDLTAVGHVVAPSASALVIGAGGGRDILTCLLFGVSHVDAVEINPIIANDVMRGRFRAAAGGIYDDPRVTIHVGDGRSFVRGSREHYDFIQLSLVDTWAATAAGAFALSENNLYTLEAFEEYIDHLTPDGVLTVTRWAGGESYRMLTLAHAALRARGAVDPGRHMALMEFPQELSATSSPVTLVLRRAPFDEASAQKVRDFVDGGGFTMLHDPLRALPGRISEMARAQDAALEARRTEDYDLAPPTDDRPFFFDRALPFLVGLRERPQRLFSEGRYLVVEVLTLATLLGVLAILLPLWRGARVALQAEAPVALRVFPYFTCLGLGFMLVEMSVMQRFVLFLGHPTHALTAVLAGLLIGAGIGSALSPRLASSSVPAPALAALIATAVLLASELAHPFVLGTAQALPFSIKLGITELLALPLGAALGTLMPLGIAQLAARAPGLVPWAWGVNGFASVVGACAAVLLSMSWGFSTTFGLGAAVYATAILAALLAAPR